MRSLRQICNQRITAANLQEDTEQQQVTAEHVHQKITQACATGLRSIAAPDQEQRGYGKCFPEENQRQPILSQCYTKSTAGIGHGAQCFHAVLVMTGINAADASHQRKNHAEYIAELIYKHVAQMIACTQKLNAQICTNRHRKCSKEGKERTYSQNELAQHFRHEHCNHAHGNEDQTRMKQITHRPHLP